ncbi:MAG TPA: maleylpyruvate isomerase family mycothiol-dependent enzyme [Nocardioides sp.]
MSTPRSDTPSDTDTAARLASYVDVWWAAVGDVLALVASLPADDWGRPTDLPGWTTHDVLAHLVHLESVTVGGDHPQVEIGDAPHVRNDMGRFTEQGVVALRDADPAALVAELRSTTQGRYDALRADPPTDPSATAPTVFGLIGWDMETFLGNRPFDLWMHEQDLRRAVGRRGGLDGVPAAYCAQRLLRSVPFVVGKRVQPTPGTSVVLEVGALPPVGVLVGDDGRARAVPLEELGEPTATLRTDLEEFCRASGGRGEPDPERWELGGDQDLARRVVAHLAVTP